MSKSLPSNYESVKSSCGYFIQNKETGERGDDFPTKLKAIINFNKKGIGEGPGWDLLKDVKPFDPYSGYSTSKKKRRLKKQRKILNELSDKNKKGKEEVIKLQMEVIQILIDNGKASKKDKAKFRRLRRKLKEISK